MMTPDRGQSGRSPCPSLTLSVRKMSSASSPGCPAISRTSPLVLSPCYLRRISPAGTTMPPAAQTPNYRPPQAFIDRQLPQLSPSSPVTSKRGKCLVEAAGTPIPQQLYHLAARPLVVGGFLTLYGKHGVLMQCAMFSSSMMHCL